jgi:hypothetical protein
MGAFAQAPIRSRHPAVRVHTAPPNRPTGRSKDSRIASGLRRVRPTRWCQVHPHWPTGTRGGCADLEQTWSSSFRSGIDNRTGAAAWECRPRTCSLSVSCFLWRPDCEVMAPEVAGDRRVSVATHVARSSDCPASTPTPTWPTLESICYQRHRRAASELEAGCVQNGPDPGTGPSSDGREPLT